MLTHNEEPAAAFGRKTVPERRAEQRRRVFKGAVVRVDSSAVGKDCFVKSISERGARLGIGKGLTLPERFQFRMSDRVVFKYAELCWQRGTDVGIRFL